MPDAFGYTIEEAARVIGIHETTAWEWVRSGRLKTDHHGPAGHGLTRTTKAYIAAAGPPHLVGCRVRMLALKAGRPAAARRRKVRASAKP